MLCIDYIKFQLSDALFLVETLVSRATILSENFNIFHFDVIAMWLKIQSSALCKVEQGLDLDTTRNVIDKNVVLNFWARL